MNDYEELTLEEMERISGGATAPINTGDDQNAGIWRKWERSLDLYIVDSIRFPKIIL